MLLGLWQIKPILELDYDAHATSTSTRRLSLIKELFYTVYRDGKACLARISMYYSSGYTVVTGVVCGSFLTLLYLPHPSPLPPFLPR